MSAQTEIFTCPECSGRLSRTPGAYHCGCGLSFPVIEGIPRFVGSQGYCRSFGLQWKLHSKAQLDSYNGFRLSEDRLFSVSGWPRIMAGQSILEAGSGAGRFTEVLASTGADVFSFDYSEAVEANRSNNGAFGNVSFFQADILRLPLPAGIFDKVLCFGVLQHTPDPEKAFLRLVEVLKPGGEIAIDIYRKDIISLLQWKYLLRPFFSRVEPMKLYALVALAVRILGPAAACSSRILGKAGSRLFPIADYSHVGMNAELSREIAVLDTFDMYTPRYDLPQTLGTVRRWFRQAGLEAVIVRKGPNGIVGIGRKPLCAG